MSAIIRPHHTGLQVADLEASLHFYRDLLGFEPIFRWNPQADYIGQLSGTRKSTFMPRSSVLPDRTSSSS